MGEIFRSDLPDGEIDIVSIRNGLITAPCGVYINYFYFTGNFQGSVDFDPDSEDGMLTSSGLRSVYISKHYYEGGHFCWVKSIDCLDTTS